jgi:hypothetical protein
MTPGVFLYYPGRQIMPKLRAVKNDSGVAD